VHGYSFFSVFEYCLFSDSVHVLTEYHTSYIIALLGYCNVLFNFFSDSLRDLFTVVRYSEKGSNERLKEEATYMHFVKYLEEIDEGTL